MCGIAGQYCLDKKAPDKDLLAEMSGRLAHRGPDGSGTHIRGNAGLVHRRLAIIDLSEEAIQPMTNEDGTLWIVYNGEIYNYVELREELAAKGHQFHSHSDTEVILHAYEEWGRDCLSRFNGMWAFAILDERKNELFCARDRFGIKPFYYTVVDGSFLFASEIKALLAHPHAGSRPDDAMLGTYLAWGVQDHSNRTMFDGILQLAPAHAIRHFGRDSRTRAARNAHRRHPHPSPERCCSRHLPFGWDRLLNAHGPHQHPYPERGTIGCGRTPEDLLGCLLRQTV
jgi:asparagine synthase (glutamine-hydrolysing)